MKTRNLHLKSLFLCSLRFCFQQANGKHGPVLDSSDTQWQMRFATASTSAEAYAAANAIALAARDGLIQTMTADGVSRFVQYVQQEKTRMIVKP